MLCFVIINSVLLNILCVWICVAFCCCYCLFFVLFCYYCYDAVGYDYGGGGVTDGCGTCHFAVVVKSQSEVMKFMASLLMILVVLWLIAAIFVIVDVRKSHCLWCCGDETDDVIPDCVGGVTDGNHIRHCRRQNPHRDCILYCGDKIDDVIADDCSGGVTDGCHIQYNIQHSLIVSA